MLLPRSLRLAPIDRDDDRSADDNDDDSDGDATDAVNDNEEVDGESMEKDDVRGVLLLAVRIKPYGSGLMYICEGVVTWWRKMVGAA